MKYLVLIVALLVFTACTTVVPIEMTPAQIQKLNMEGNLPLKNKDLVIVKNDNTELKAVVISTTETSIITNKGEVPYSDIREIKIVRIDKSQTAKNIGVGLGAYFVIGLVVLVSTLNGI